MIEQKTEILDKLVNDYLLVKDDIGKCESTHRLTRKFDYIDATARKCIDVFISSGNYPPERHKIDLDKISLINFSLEELEQFRIVKKYIELSYVIQRDELNNNTLFSFKYCYSTRAISSWEPIRFKYEMSEFEFNTILNNIDRRIVVLGNNLREYLPNWELGLTIGENAKDKKIMEYLNKLSKPIIEIETSLSAQLLENHPYLYAGKYLVCSEDSLKILNIMITEQRTPWGDNNRELNRVIEKVKEKLQK